MSTRQLPPSALARRSGRAFAAVLTLLVAALLPVPLRHAQQSLGQQSLGQQSLGQQSLGQQSLGQQSHGEQSHGEVGERPNLLWLTVEDMSPWLPCYGDDTVPTPNLDRLRSEGVRFTNAFASSPVCAPARSTLITGMYATRIATMHMRTGNPSKAALERDPSAYDGIPGYEGLPPEWVRCFPERLRRAGYYCTNSAKTDYQFRAPATTWDESSGDAHWRNRPDGSPFFAVFNHGGTHESQAFPSARRRPSVVEPADVPLPPLYPDTPAVRDELARTYDNIAAMDAWVGRQLDALEQAGLADSTVVFFFSDHGVGLPRGKRSPYDLGTRVPLLVRFPDGRGAGTDDERVVSFEDFGPTVLSLAGIEPDARLDGVPFLGSHAREGDGYAYTHADRFDSVYDRARSVTDGRFRYVRNYVQGVPHLIDNAYRENLRMMADLHALRDRDDVPAPQWQVASTRRPPEELYDSAADPWEVVNLAADTAHSQTLERLRAALDAWIDDTGDLGLIVPEAEMVAAHVWPDLEQPRTATPTVTVEGDRLVLACETPGASLGYRWSEEQPWRPYSGPLPAAAVEQLAAARAAADGERLRVRAHRIGFAPATTRDPAREDEAGDD